MTDRSPLVVTVVASAVYAVLGFLTTWVYTELPLKDLGALVLFPSVGAMFQGAAFLAIPVFGQKENFRRMFRSDRSRAQIVLPSAIALLWWFAGALSALLIWRPVFLSEAFLYSLISAPAGFVLGTGMLKFYERYRLARQLR